MLAVLYTVHLVTWAVIGFITSVQSQEYCEDFCAEHDIQCFQEGTEYLCLCGDDHFCERRSCEGSCADELSNCRVNDNGLQFCDCHLEDGTGIICEPRDIPIETTPPTTTSPISPNDTCPPRHKGINEPPSETEPCKNCPKPCKEKIIMSDLDTATNFHGFELKPGLRIHSGFNAITKINKKGCTSLVITSDDLFCIHSFLPTIEGTCDKVKAKVTDDKGNKLSVNLCVKDGKYDIPEGVVDGRKVSRFELQLCPASCQLSDWILCVCIKESEPVDPEIPDCPKGEVGLGAPPAEEGKECKNCPKKCKEKVTLSDVDSATDYHHDKVVNPGTCLEPDFSTSMSITDEGYNILSITREDNAKFCIHSFNATFAGTCSNITAQVLKKNPKDIINVTLCKSGDGSIVIPIGPIDSIKVSKFELILCPGTCKLVDWILCVCINPKSVPAIQGPPSGGSDPLPQCPGSGGSIDTPEQDLEYPCEKCPDEFNEKVTISDVDYSRRYTDDIVLKAGTCLEPDFTARMSVNKKGYGVLRITRKPKEAFCLHTFSAKFFAKCDKITARVLRTFTNKKGKKKKHTIPVELCKNGTDFVIPRGPIDSKEIRKFELELCPGTCKLIDWVMCACVDKRTIAD